MSQDEFWTHSFCQCSIAAVRAGRTASGKENASISENKAAGWEQNEYKKHDRRGIGLGFHFNTTTRLKNNNKPETLCERDTRN